MLQKNNTVKARRLTCNRISDYYFPGGLTRTIPARRLTCSRISDYYYPGCLTRTIKARRLTCSRKELLLAMGPPRNKTNWKVDLQQPTRSNTIVKVDSQKKELLLAEI